MYNKNCSNKIIYI